MKRSIVPRSRNTKSSLIATRSPFEGRNHKVKGTKQDKPTLIGLDLQSEEMFGFLPKQRENHTHILGSTGTGKSKFMELLLRQDIQNPKCGVCLIDPHGRLYHDTLTYIATTKSTLSDRIVLFNPFNDLDSVMGFNPLPSDKTRLDYIEKTFVASCLKAWGQDDLHETPRIARWLQSIAHTLLVNDMTLLESAALISSAKHDPFRKALIDRVSNETIRIEWDMLEAGSQSKRTEMIEGAGNRLHQFLQNEVIRLIIGQKSNVLDLTKIMEEGKILLINLNDESGRVTAPDAKLLGTMIVSELYRVSKLRDSLDPKLKPFYVYIDEFAQFVTRDVARSLEETRKFKTFFLLAHQHLAQLKREDEYLYASVLTNCKNKVVFGGLSEEDADVMTKAVQTGFLDLKQIKHEQMRIRERHIETVRTVRSNQNAESRGHANQTSSGTARSDSTARGESSGETHSASETRSQQEGRTQSTSRAEMRGSSDGRNQSQGTTQNDGVSSSRSRSQSQSDGQSESLTYGRSDTEGESFSKNQSNAYSRGGSSSQTQGQSDAKTRGRSATETEGSGETSGSSYMTSENSGRSSATGQNRTMMANDYEYASRSYADNSGTNQSSGYSDGMSNSSTLNRSASFQDSASRTKTQSSSETQGSNWSDTNTNGHTKGTNSAHTESSGEQFGKSQSQQMTDGITEGNNSSKGHSQTNSVSKITSQSATDTQSHGTTESEGEATTEGIARSKQQSLTNTTGTTQSEGRSQTESASTTQSYGESVVPFLEPLEVEETSSIQFWSLNELMFMKKGQLMNLDVAQAFVKVENLPPVHCKVAYIPEKKMSPKLREDFRKSFERKVRTRNADQYLPLADAKAQIAERQTKVFGTTINFHDTLLATEANDAQLIEGEMIDEDKRDKIFGR